MSVTGHGYSRVDPVTTTSFDTGSQGDLIPRRKMDKHNSVYVPHNRFSRYTAALSNLVPVRFHRVPGSEIPIDKIGLFSSVSFNWLTEYISAGCKNGMQDKPLPSISTPESCQINGPRIDALWHAHVVQQGQAGASVPKIAWHFVKTRVLVGSFIYLLGMIISFLSPIIVLQQIIAATEKRMHLFQDPVISGNSSTSSSINSTSNGNTTVQYFENNQDNFKREVLIDEVVVFTEIGILISAEIISYFLIAWSAALNLRTATRLRSACLALAYKKLVRSSVRYRAPVHQTLTYFVPDSNTLYELIENGPLIFSGPLILLLSSLFIWHSMGHWALIGIAVLIALYLGLVLTACLTKIFATRAMKYSLQRFTLLQELISKITLAKMGKYDKRFISQIRLIREKEMGEMKLGALSEGWSLSMVHVIPIVTVSVTTVAYLMTHNQIISAKYIPCLVLILLNLKHCVRSSWLAMSSISRGIASLNNLKAILILKDANRYPEKPIDKNLAITINAGHFSWEQDKSPSEKIIRRSSHFSVSGQEGIPVQLTKLNSPHVLHELNFYATKGKIIGICGPPGSGKSSLLFAIMGQLNHISGHVAIDGTFSFVPDDPWLFEGTLKENIILGEQMDPTCYYRAIQACNLSDDLSQLPASDDTDIFTVDLSNAQKQKIALARAIFTNKEINLFDNPLKDLGIDEAMEIFEKSFKVLRGKTIILVSDEMRILKRCDTICILKNGKIVQQGSHQEMIQIENEYSDLMNMFEKKSEHVLEENIEEEIKPTRQTSIDTINEEIIVEVEDRESDNDEDDDRDSEFRGFQSVYGLVSGIKYRNYISSEKGECFSGFICCLSVFYSFPIAAAPLIFTFIAQRALTDTANISIILASMLGLIIFWGIILVIVYNKNIFTAARNMHEKWLEQIYRAHTSAFSSHSSTILLNIFSLSLQEIDYVLPRLKITALMHIGISIFSIITLGILSLWLLIPITLFIIVSLSYNFYVRGLLLTLHGSKIDSVLPIYSHTANIVKERAVIQAYRKDREFSKKFYKHCNANSMHDFMLNAIKLWIEFRIKFSSAASLAVIMLICACVSEVKDRYEVLGLAFICSIQLTQSIVHLTGAIMDAYGSVLTIGVVDKFIMSLPQERFEGNDVKKEWPTAPSIHFQNALLTNSPTLDQEPLNFSIYPADGESVSNIAHMNFDHTTQTRIVKALLQFQEVFSGSILIGSYNIADISVDTFRNHVDYLPRYPNLFEGNIRYNLDPVGRIPDKTLISVLQKVFLWDKISKLDERLDNDAKNVFSLSEKKIMILARIYLNSPCNNRHIIIVENLGHTDGTVRDILSNVFREFTIVLLSKK